MVFGYLLALAPTLQKRLSDTWMLNGILGVVCFLLKEVIWIAFHLELGYTVGALIVITCRTAAAYLFVLTALGFGDRYLNADSALLTYCKGLAFPFYILHFIPVTVLTYYLLDTGWHFYARFAIVTILSYPAIFFLYEILVKRIWPIGLFMGTLKYAKKTKSLKTEAA
jgi:hypothetical protein